MFFHLIYFFIIKFKHAGGSGGLALPQVVSVVKCAREAPPQVCGHEELKQMRVGS